ncbi:transposable element Tcb2 transposase [Trichonephila clavipes]|nr:transposable element Tcb2 transposase [Trichonephila clavipes]
MHLQEPHLSRVTVSKRLHEIGLFIRRPTASVPFKSTNRRVHLAWCRQHRDLEERGTYYLHSNVHESDNYGGEGLMVWADIVLDGRAPLHVFERGFVTGVRYRDDVLKPYVRLFMGACDPEFIVMEDNARSHRALLFDGISQIDDDNLSTAPIMADNVHFGFFFRNSKNVIDVDSADENEINNTVPHLDIRNEEHLDKYANYLE